MKRLLVSALTLTLVAATSHALAGESAAFRCTPIEKNHGPNALASAEVVYSDGQWYVSYRTFGGNTYRRADQYEMHSVVDAKGWYWMGPLKRNPSLVMTGSLQAYNGSVYYVERIRDTAENGAVVATIMSGCLAEGNTSHTQPEDAGVTQAIQDAAEPIRALVKCRTEAAIAMAIASNEPAETVAEAAKGACVREGLALDDSLVAHGLSYELVNAFHSSFDSGNRATLIATVIEARAVAAARSSERQNPAPTRQPL